MDDDLSLKPALPNTLNNAASDSLDGGIRNAEPEDIGFELSAIERGQRQSTSPGGTANRRPLVGDDDLLQTRAGCIECLCKRAAPVAEPDDGNAALHTGWYFKIVPAQTRSGMAKKASGKNSP